MRTVLPALLLAVVLPGCSTLERSMKNTAPELPGSQWTPESAYAVSDESAGEEMASVPRQMSDHAVLESAPASKMRMAKNTTALLGQVLGGADHSEARPAAPPPPPPKSSRPTEMMDIEANVHLIVEQVGDAAALLRQMVKTHDGSLVEDVVDRSGHSSGRFTARIPADKTEAFLAAIEHLGSVRSRQINARDIGKEFFDAQILLDNLMVTMKRYEQILERAQAVADILSIERELTRVRGQIEKVKGSLRWMGDRVARSTIHIFLVAPASVESEQPLLPQAALYPGIRMLYTRDLRGNGVNDPFWGVGISFRWHRHFSLDLDGLRRWNTGSPTKGLDTFLITAGGEGYSEFLGNGRRTFLNPYLGGRVGFARSLGHSEAVLGATVGVELLHTRYIRIDLDFRALGLIGKSSHVLAMPALSANVAF